MHRSRLSGVIIDCRTDDLESAGRFWAAALGRTPRRSDRPEDAGYVVFERGPDGLDIQVQKVEHESRVHIDIEADDVEAEAARLEKLGARRLRQVRDWLVMEAPTGQRFCIVPASSPDFATAAKVWP